MPLQTDNGGQPVGREARSRWMAYLAVFVGGAAGGLSRELLTPAIASTVPLTATLLVNTVACLALGWLTAVRHRLHQHVTHLAAVGFCGGLSTFSSFVAELALLGGTHGSAVAASAAGVEIGAGLGAAAIGLALGHRLHGRACP